MEDIDKRNNRDGIEHKPTLEIVHGYLLNVFDWLPCFYIDVFYDELEATVRNENNFHYLINVKEDGALLKTKRTHVCVHKGRNDTDDSI